jgi:hypothetical protein
MTGPRYDGRLLGQAEQEAMGRRNKARVAALFLLLDRRAEARLAGDRIDARETLELVRLGVRVAEQGA